VRRLAHALALGALVLVEASGCSRSKAEMFETAQTDTAILGKLVTLRPAPAAATWSVAKLGSDSVPGPTDSALWAVLRYADADAASVARTLKAEAPLPSVTVSAPPLGC
jgi:hypothetical protein